MNKLTAQVAAEAILNNPDAFGTSTIEAVLLDAEKLGVAGMYVDGLRSIWEDRGVTYL